MASKLKLNEVLLQSPNGLVEKTLSMGDDGIVKMNGVQVADTDIVNTKANVVQEAWNSPTLLNSWVNYGAGEDTVGYFKDTLGFVHIRGMIKSGTLDAVVFNLPVGYRPLNYKRFAIISNNLWGLVTLFANGGVRASIGSNAWFNFGEIIFKAEQ
jgi:hypothetical protein